MDYPLGSSSHRAILSTNGHWLAAIVENKEIQIVNINFSCPQGRLFRRIKIQDQAFASRVNTIRWSPETLSSSGPNRGESETSSEIDRSHDQSRILLSDGRYIQIYDVWDTERKRQLLLHLDIGDAYGKISQIDFAFDHHHALIMTDTNIQASVLTIDSRQHVELKAPKFNNLNSFAFHPKGQHVTLLTRTDGKDLVTIYSIGESSWTIEATFTPSTVDAQAMLWSPDGRFIAICDAASMGCRIYFYTADGQRLDHMDIKDLGTGTDIMDFEGLGVKSMTWFTSSGLFAVTDFAGNIVIRRMTESYKWIVVDVLSHKDQLDDPSTFIWHEALEKEQLIEQVMRPFSLATVELQTSAGIPRSVEIMKDNCDGSMLASTSGVMPGTVWIWQGFRSPLAIMNLRDPVRQVLWHPSIPDALLIITASLPPRIHLWTRRSEPKSTTISLSKNDATSGKVEVRWAGNRSDGFEDEEELQKIGEADEDYLFVITNEKCFDLGFIEKTGEDVKFRSILNDDSVSARGIHDSNESRDIFTTISSKKNGIVGTGDPEGMLHHQAPYHRWKPQQMVSGAVMRDVIQR